MKIAIKGIYHERTEDAPFVGALICADTCYYNCTDCINDELKCLQSFYTDENAIIREVLSNPFNEGIILAGLEWTLQPLEMLCLIDIALKNNLEVILYTGMTMDELFKSFPQLKHMNIYIKCGRYIKSLHVNGYKKYGVTLASSNQEIVKCGGNNE